MLTYYKKLKSLLKPCIKTSGIVLICLQLSCAPARDKQRVVVAGAGKIDSLDPAQANTVRTLQLISALGDTLYTFNKEGSLQPHLAKEYPWFSKDRRSLFIRLRRNINFHDGERFNAKAMEFSLNRFMRIGTLNYLINDKVESVQAIDEYTLKIKLKKPSTSINGLLSSVNLTPVSPKSYANYKDKFLNTNFIGTGPYKLRSFSSQQQLIDPFTDYWGEKPRNKGIDYISFNNSTTLFGSIRTGEIDVLLANSINDIQRKALAEMAKKGLLNEGIGPAMEIGFITLKSNKGILKEQRIRKAISYSIDRDLISQKVSFGIRSPLRSIIPPELKGSKESPWPKYNPNKTRLLLKEEGFCSNKIVSIPLTFRSNVPADRLMALLWKEQIKRDLSDCLEINLNGVESTTIYKQLPEGAFEAVILDWTGAYPDPEAYLTPLLSCSKSLSINHCEEGESVFSGSFWTHPRVQRLLSLSESSYEKKRLNYLLSAEHLAAEGAAYLPIWLVKSRAWSQVDVSQPKFNMNGMVMLDLLRRN